jgi:hypothetical protein
MKYFGKKSLSSWVSIILHIAWYALLIGSILGVIFAALILFSVSLRELIETEVAKEVSNMDYKDQKDWETFMNLPIYVRLVLLPYLGAVIVLLLKIIKKSQSLFTNFKNDIIFNNSNVEIISKTNKLLIIYSIITFNLSTMLVCVLLLMISEIFKNGSALCKKSMI